MSKLSPEEQAELSQTFERQIQELRALDAKYASLLGSINILTGELGGLISRIDRLIEADGAKHQPTDYVSRYVPHPDGYKTKFT